MTTRPAVENGFDWLTIEELRALREALRRTYDTAPMTTIRSVIACINEVDAAIERKKEPA